MRKIKHFLSISLSLMILNSCCSIGLCHTEKSAIENGRKMILNNEAECVIVHDGEIVAFERGKGVSPLLRLYETQGERMKDGILVDKVIGRAAAFIAIKGGIVRGHGELVSEDAVELLKQHNIPCTHTKLVYRILNPKRDGLCPLEDSVLGIDNIDQALEAIRKRMAELRAAAQAKKP